MVRRTGCALLLDLNNAYVSCTNHGRDARAYVDSLPLHAVGEVHLAGFDREIDGGGSPLLIDAHGSPIDDAVWALFESTIARLGPLTTLIERDQRVPPLTVLVAEAGRVEAALRAARAPAEGAR